MKAEVTDKTHKQLKAITKKRKELGKSDWASHHILAPIVDRLYKKECEK